MEAKNDPYQGPVKVEWHKVSWPGNPDRFRVFDRAKMDALSSIVHPQALVAWAPTPELAAFIAKCINEAPALAAAEEEIKKLREAVKVAQRGLNAQRARLSPGEAKKHLNRVMAEIDALLSPEKANEQF